MNHPIISWLEMHFVQFDIGQLFLSWQLRGLLFLLAGVVLLRALSASSASRHLIVSAIFSALLFLPVLTLFGPVVTIEMPTEVATYSDFSSNYFYDRASLFLGSSFNIQLFAYGCYLLGLAFFLLRLLLANLVMWWINSHASTCKDQYWLRELNAAKQTMGVNKSINLRYSVTVKSPLTWGVINPVIFLPVSAAHWPQPLINSTLLHELAHISRNDWLSHQVIQIACALYWINPLSWFIARQLLDDAETACDDKVLDAGVETTRYAEDLVFVAQHMKNLMHPATVAMSINRKPSQLHERIRSILSFSSLVDLSASEARILAAVILGILLPLASIRTQFIEVPTSQRSAVPFLDQLSKDSALLEKEEDQIPREPTTTFYPEEDSFDHQAFKKIAIESAQYEATVNLANSTPNSHTFTSHTLISHALPSHNMPIEKIAVTNTQLPENPALSFWQNSKVKHDKSSLPEESKPIEVIENATARYENRRIVKPRYPRYALAQGIQGEVVVSFWIDSQGRVINPTVISATPEGVFDKHVLRAVKQFEFAPTASHSDAQLYPAQETFRFILES